MNIPDQKADSPMDAQENLIKHFMRVTESEEGIVLEIAVVNWKGAYDPFLVWYPFWRWKRFPSPERLRKAQDKALASRKFFCRCALCEELNNLGTMYNSSCCQACAAERGVVF